MSTVTVPFIEVHLFRRRRGKVEYLLIRRAAERSLAGVWQPVTGGIEKGEEAWRAAAREVIEETGLRPLRWWALEYLSVFYKPDRDAVFAVPTFAAEVAWSDTVVLSDEHDRYAFVSPAEAARRVIWATQRRAMAAIREEILAPGVDPSAREVTARIAAAQPALAVAPKWARKPAPRRRARRT